MLAELLQRVSDLEQAGVDAAGVPISLLRFATAFLLSVPVGIVFRYVPTEIGRHLYAAITGFLLLYYPFRYGTFHLFVPSVLTYGAMHQMPEHSATLSWLFSFAYLIACHVASASGAKWREGNVDFTGAMMVLALKLISAGVSYQDGRKKDEELTPYQQAHAVRRLPSLLEWLSFIFSAGNLLAGPYFELSDYLAYIERRGPWDPKATPQPSLANQYQAGALRFAKALACVVAYFWAVQYLPIEAMESDWYHALSLPKKAVVIWLVSVVYRFRYYFAWAVSEAALIFSGFCFNGWAEGGKRGGDAAPDRARWDRCMNTRIRQVEFSTSAAELPAHWNTCTGNFLRRYVYERLTPRGKKATFTTLLTTQIVAGVWHGLFPGYALFFVTSAFMFESAKVIYRYERALSPRWRFLRTFAPWQFIKWAYTAFVLDYSAAAFLLLEWRASIDTWASVYFLGHIMMGSIILVSLVNPPRRPRKKDVAKEAATQPQPPIETGPTIADVAKTDSGEHLKADEATWTARDMQQPKKEL